VVEVSWVAVAAVAGAGCVAAGGLLGLARGLAVGLGAQAAGVVLLGVAGCAVLADGAPVGAGFRSAVDPALGLDALSGFFLLVLSVIALPALIFARDALPSSRRGGVLTALTAAFLLAMAGLVAARDVSTFLASWELMTLIPASAILVARQDAEVRGAVFVYLAVTHLGGVGVWVAMLVLANEGVLGGAPLTPGGLQALVATAALIGFSTKAGLVPLHVWLPRAHPVAPSHISALMSGVMIKLALYGLVRVLFEWLVDVPLWVGLALLAVGAASALAGVLYALMQHELKRLLAFHSIENVGIIALALGASLVLAARDEPVWSALAFAAALLHTLNHAVFKAALFLGAGAIAGAVGELELDRLGGLLRRMPWTGAAFLVASMAIAGVPPLNGFASEWLTLQALVQTVLTQQDALSIVGAGAVVALAATAALAALCFVKVVGLVLLGEPRREECARAVEAPWGMRASVAALAGLCVALGAAAGLIVPRLSELGPGTAVLTAGAAVDAPGTGSLPSLALVVGAALMVALLWRARQSRRAEPAPAWACGQPAAPALSWTSAGFTKPLRLVLESVLRPRREVTVRAQRGVVQEIVYRGEVPHLFDTHLYEPATRVARRAAGRARRLQSGSLRAYLLYLLALLVVVLALARWGMLG
jgi:hydrogenase-4 component B